MHKTGTTSIQQALHDHREPLARAGVLVPRTDREPWPELPKHCSVFSAAVSGDPRRSAEERRILLDEFSVSGASTMVISEEGLSEPNEVIPRLFEPMAEVFDIDVICYVRRPDLFVESLYNQFVRETLRQESRPILVFARAARLQARLDYAAMLAPWRKLAASVVVQDFDQARLHDGLVGSFVHAARLPASSLSAGGPGHAALGNPSIDMRLAVMLSQLNRMRVRYDLASMRCAAHGLIADKRFPPLRHILGRDERRRLLAELRPLMENFGADYGVRFSAELPADEPAAATETVDAAYATELAARLSDLP